MYRIRGYRFPAFLLCSISFFFCFFFFQAEDGIRDVAVTGVQTCALPIFPVLLPGAGHSRFPRDGNGLGSRSTITWKPRMACPRKKDRKPPPSRAQGRRDRKSVV